MKKLLKTLTTILIAMSLVALFSCKQTTTETGGGGGTPITAVPTFKIAGTTVTGTGLIGSTNSKLTIGAAKVQKFTTHVEKRMKAL